MDDIDRAQGFNETFQADALGAWKRNQTTGESRSECLECEEEIPEKRRQAIPGCQLCIECQRALEQAQRRRP